MKKSVKILIVVLCLIIVGLVTFIVVDKLININGKNSQSNVVESVNNTNNNENTQSSNVTISINGTYKRNDDSERTSGTLSITKYNENSFEFKIDATKVIGSNTQKSIENGSVNMGGTSGIAKKVSDNVFEFVSEKDDELMESFEGEYKIRFTVNNKSITIEEVYDKTKHSQGPYSGGQVRFDGVYDLVNSKVEKNQNTESDSLLEANEAIKDALKNDTWIKNNVFSKPISESFSVYKSMYGNDWYRYAKDSMVFARISTGDVPMYIVGVVNPAASEDYYLLTYKDGNVVVNVIPHSDYAFSTFDLNNNVVKLQADYGTEYFGYNNDNEYILVAETHNDEVQVDDGNGNNTNTSLNVTYKINNEIVSAKAFENFENQYNFVKIETKLTNENIDKI